jgi:Cft2 family RNA processing exonuclease
MEFVNLTRHVGIGSNCYWLRVGGKNIVLDAGSDPKIDGLGATPDLSPLPEGSVDAIIVTHAHQDHCGSLPFLTRREQDCPVFCTAPTARLMDTMLHNSVSVMVRQREELDLPEYPLYTHRGVELSSRSWVPCALRKRFNLRGEPSDSDQEVTFEFHHAGHILGSAGVMIRYKGKSLFYTGDVCFEDQTIMCGADFPRSGVDYLVMETTRGDSPTPPAYSRQTEEERFGRAVSEAVGRGALTIPVFALGKSQELLAMLWRMRLHGLIPHLPLYIGGLSVKVTTTYDQLADMPPRRMQELQLLHEMAPYILSGREIQSASPRKRSIYALSSGMMTPNTLSNIFARRVLPDPNQSLFFIGYSDPESPAGRIRAAAPGDEIVLEENKPPVPLRCKVREFNFSAHANRELLRNYALLLKPSKVLLVHGDRPALEWFQLSLFKELHGSEILIPEHGKPVTLD